MARLRRVPPGRAGRLWLQHRLAVAERAVTLLDQKLRVLHAETERRAAFAVGTGRAWAEASTEAAVWLERAALLGGERAVRLAGGGPPVDVVLSWTWTMGVRHPDGSTCSFPPDPDELPAANTPIVLARAAHRRALEAAAQHAAAQAALRLLQAEERATRRRVRALEDRWLPLLRNALRERELALEEQEHADWIRLRWTLDRPRDP